MSPPGLGGVAVQAHGDLPVGQQIGRDLRLGLPRGAHVEADRVPLGGEQTPEDIGNLAVFYASDEARMITGQSIAVDGGRLRSI